MCARLTYLDRNQTSLLSYILDSLTTNQHFELILH